jgi:hypothetical protein
MAAVGHAVETNSHIKVLQIERVAISLRALKELSEGVRKTQTLRELTLVDCGLTDEHLEQIKQSLAENRSLISLNLGHNQLCEVGGMVGHILAEHAHRRNEVVFFLNIRNEVPVDDLSNTGLCEVNLEHNRLNDKSVAHLVSSLKADAWTKCLNLRSNMIRAEGVRELALLLKENSSLISLDLRGNEGLSREYSRFIYKKLVLNMEKYKQQKELFQKSKELQGNHSHHSRRHTPVKEREQMVEELSKFKSVRDQHYGRYDSKEYTTIAEPPRQPEKNNMTLDRKMKARESEGKSRSAECADCKAKTFEMLRLEKKNLDLEWQLRKVKHMLLTKNVDISAIVPANNQ